MSTAKLLLLNGSPRKKGTSYSFSRTIKKLVEDAGSIAEIIHLIDYFDGKAKFDTLKDSLLKSDVIALVSPLYSDTLPYFNIWMLEKLVSECKDDLKGKNFFAVGQCGFPDITRIEPLLDAGRFFAEDMGMKWLGGLAYGGGAMINGTLLEDLGERGKRITSGFEMAVQNILRGERISPKSQETITLKIPRTLYWPLIVYLNTKIKKLAKENGNVDYGRKVYLE
ncbi:MAG: hypothetical protein N3I35_12375 [Clostridia bacterium]|nr:hypothetical protein [Clostridia bacterium]